MRALIEALLLGACLAILSLLFGVGFFVGYNVVAPAIF